MNKICPNCKTENRNIARYCKNCGKELISENNIVRKAIEEIVKAEDLIDKARKIQIDEHNLDEFKKAEKYLAEAKESQKAQDYAGAIEWAKQCISTIKVVINTSKNKREQIQEEEKRHKEQKRIQFKNLVPLKLVVFFTIILTIAIGIYINSKKKYEGMVYIPAGEFLMGSDGGDSDEKPVHRVYLDAYYIDKYEVTFEQYDKFCEATGRTKPSDSGWGRGNRPVINVSWDNAVAYAEWAGKRLPTEAEWEKACKSGSESKYCFGDDAGELHKYGNYCDISNTDGFLWQDKNHDDGYDKTAPVGSLKPNKYGLYDMHGNVWEWCSDWYDSGYYSKSPSNNPEGPGGGSSRVLRGGGWNDVAGICRSAFRGGSSPGGGNYGWGFRCAVGVVQGR